MKTRCKFVVEKVTKYAGPWETITLNAVYSDGTQENDSFSSATPTGKLEITVTNPNVLGKIIPGTFYYLDMIPV